MTDKPIAPDRREAARVVVTELEFDQLVEELHVLRSTHRVDLAARLRAAHGHGVAGDNDDRLAVMEDVVVDTVKIAQLERLIASATVVGTVPVDGAVGLGSIVRVEGHDGRRAEYEFVGVRKEDAARAQVTPGSPIGQALLGAQAGDVVDVTLPNGRRRELTVLDVVTASISRAVETAG